MTVAPTPSVLIVQPQAVSNPSVTTSPLPENVVAAAAQAPIPDAPSPLQQLAAAIVGDAAARQNGLAPLYADLAALAQSGQPLPQPVAAVMRQMLGASLDVASKPTVDAAEIKNALMQSGLVAAQPAMNASTMAAAAASAMPAQVAGLNMLLGLLRRSLTTWAESEENATPADAAARATVSTAEAAQTLRNAAPPPPFRNGPTVAQPPAQSMLPENLSGPALAQHLLAETEAAIARQTLLQIASLPDAAPDAPRQGADGRHLMFDVPLATPQGMAVAQFRIERDAPHRDGETGKPTWRASFAIDVEPIGRVHAHIALVGGRTAVTLRAERPDSAALLNDNVAQLEASLREADLEPGTLACVNGAASPPAPAAAPGLFLDSTT